MASPTKRKFADSDDDTSQPNKSVRTAACLRPSKGLYKLPEEVLLRIAEKFTEPLYDRTSMHALHSLSLTNQQFYRVANPLLYSIINTQFCDAPKLAKTLLDVPQLGFWIKFLACQNGPEPKFHTFDLNDRYAILINKVA